MADNEISHRGRHDGPAGEDLAVADALQAEICFWQEMIETSSTRLPPEAVERMGQAKALAESRLRRHRAISDPQADNVFRLDQARRTRR